MKPFSELSLSKLVNKSTKINFKEFTQTVQKSLILLSKKTTGRKILGKLVQLPETGHAIVIGDLHGDLKSLQYILSNTNFLSRVYDEDDVSLIFLGDYGDRGVQSPEVYYVILKIMELFPKNVILLRGNHEGPDDLRVYPHELPNYLFKKFGKKGIESYNQIRQIFNQLYNAVLIKNKLVMLHGGVPSLASCIEDLAFAHSKHPSESHLEEILWNDPVDDLLRTYPSPRGAGKLFGTDVTHNLLKMLNVNVIIRGHEPCQKGYKINHSGKILTLFSRRGVPYNNTYGAYLQLNLSSNFENINQLQKHIHTF